jgi:hypothetical protein
MRIAHALQRGAPATVLAVTLSALGDATFYRILRTFLRSYRGHNAGTADFIRIAVYVSGKTSVRKLLRDWLYGEAVPALPGGPAIAKGGPIALPDLVGSRCGHGSHRGAPRVCPD